jgi:hypothetical protein
MGTYQITGPDGKKYRVTGDTPEGAFEALQQHIGGQAGAGQEQGGGITGMADAFGRGIVNSTTLGFGDEIGAGARWLGGKVLPWRDEVTWEQALDEVRGSDEAVANANPGSSIAGNVTGALGLGAGLAKSGLSMSANAIERGARLGRVAATSAGEGAILGGISGFGSGEGVDDRIGKSVTGGLLGGSIGLATPLVVAGGGKLAKTVTAPVMARLMPERYADDAIGTALKRSGRTPDQIANIMQGAIEDGQRGYAVMDAMGHTGQRLASTVTRNPHEERQAFVEFIRNRQAGAGERLSNAIAEGFDAFDTAAQRAGRMTADRTKDANRLYAAARRDAGAVDISGALAKIDETLNPGLSGIFNPRDKIANDSIEGALARVRSMISDGRSNLTDFDAVFRAKLDIDDMIERAVGQGAGNRVHYLSQVQQQIDDALAGASKSYAKARDAFSRASREIDAVDIGKAATRPSSRAEDNIAAFGNMTPREQAAFRSGYADPLIARVDSMSLSPTTNKARALQTPKLEQELQAFAVPGKSDQLGRRIGREQRMFDTANAALGGSKTADNLADAADFAQFDPSILASFATGGFSGALMNGIGRVASELKGTPPSVAKRIAQAIMEADPEAARQILTQGAQKVQGNDRLRALIGTMLTTGGASGAGRL